MDGDQKWCPLCEQILPLSSFYTTYCKPCNAAKRKRWREANRARANAQQLAYNRTNAEKRKRWTAINRERSSDKRREYIRRYRRKHPDKHANSEGKRRAAKRTTSSALCPQVAAIYRRAASEEVIACEYCGKPTVRGGRHVDHRTPLSRGGGHTIDNLSICCCQCNLKKAIKTADEFTAGGAS